MDEEIIRLQKIISEKGITSRRGAERLIKEGRVKVEGETITQLGTRVSLKNLISIDNKSLLPSQEKKVYLILNKPAGFISSLADPQKRPLVTDLLPKGKGRLYPVGRLDYDTEGFLLFTNDGDLTQRLLHPKYKIPKTYLVKIKGSLDNERLEKLRKGIRLEEGKIVTLEVKILFSRKAYSLLRLVVTEGKKRMIKRIMSSLGNPVIELKRIGFAFLRIGSLKSGQYRYLSPKEIERLKDL